MYGVGDTLDNRYHLTRLLGQGGMGAVYEAEHVILEKQVAIKLLHPGLAENTEALERFYREARTASKLGLEGIVEISDVGQAEDGSPYLVMELLEGESLAELLAREKTLSQKFVLDLAEQILLVLIEVHALGIVHRDLKPDNIFLCLHEDGSFQAKLLDFGICKIAPDADGPALTHTGSVMGTPYYMSPEQARGTKEVDHRTDIWSIGVIMYEALTGRVPYPGEHYNVVIAALLTEDYQRPSALRPEISKELEAVLLKAMARDVEERYDWPGKFLADLRVLREDDSTRVAVNVLASAEAEADPDPQAETAPASECDTQAETTSEGQQDLVATEADLSIGEKETLAYDGDDDDEATKVYEGGSEEVTRVRDGGRAETPAMVGYAGAPLAEMGDTLGAVTRETLPGVKRSKLPLWFVGALAVAFVGSGGVVIGLLIFLSSWGGAGEESVPGNREVAVATPPGDTPEPAPSAPALVPLRQDNATATKSATPSPLGTGGEGPVISVPLPAEKNASALEPSPESSSPAQVAAATEPQPPIKTRPQVPAPPTQSQSRPLTKREVSSQLRAVAPRVVECARRGGARAARITAMLQVNGDGTTTYRGTSPAVPTSASGCIRRVLGRVRYRATGRASFRVRYPFTIRQLKSNPLH